ncbi:hypothetical protein CYY_007079 [Polysphondylium violaceum]|uniref:Ankyrin repeat-containing protein n=1 Tax=Polysphondylium violaceum TaxID=133409 RepID=A0A8J4UY89_9MYCE|nr:hypothetical protein CYY_007079 [Polysphondylium violaceum]
MNNSSNSICTINSSSNSIKSSHSSNSSSNSKGNNSNSFKDIINNKYIRSNIFKYIRGGIKYYDICKFEWIVKNKHFNLLKYKIHRKEYLFIDYNSLEYIFQIKDIETFNRFYNSPSIIDYFQQPPSVYNQWSHYCCKYDNLELLKHLINNNNNVVNYPNLSEAFRYATKNKNKEMILYLWDHLERLVPKELKELMDVIVVYILKMIIDMNQVDLVQYMLESESPKNCKFNQMQKVALLKQASRVGDLEMFQTVYKFVKKRSMDLESIKVDREWFKELIEFDGSGFLSIERKEKTFITQEHLSFMTEIKFNQLTHYLKLERDKQRAVDENFRKKPGLLEFSSMKDWLVSLERVQQLHSSGVRITSRCIEKAAKKLRLENTSSWDMFKYLFDHFIQPTDSGANKALVNKLLSIANTTNNPKIIQLLLTKYEPNHGWWTGLAGDDKNLDFIKYFFDTFGQQLEHQGHFFTGLNNAAKTGAIQVFKYIFTKFDQRIDMNQFYHTACFHSHYHILEFLISQNISHVNKVIGKSTSMEMVDFLLKHGHTITNNTLNTFDRSNPLPDVKILAFVIEKTPNIMYANHHLLLLLETSIQQHKFQHFKLLLQHYKMDAPERVLGCIGTHGNLEMLQHYYQLYPSHNEFYRFCFINSLKEQHLSLIRFLFENINTYDLFLNESQSAFLSTIKSDVIRLTTKDLLTKFVNDLNISKTATGTELLKDLDTTVQSSKLLKQIIDNLNK